MTIQNLILPQPKSFKTTEGQLTATRFKPNFPTEHNDVPQLFPDLVNHPESTTPIHAEIISSAPPESYKLTATPNHISITAADRSGLFYALQTLSQIIRQTPTPIPCFTIEDAPDLPIRGLSLDVSRGKVTKLETLLHLADRLAQLKINHLQLYVEHTFAFTFDPDIHADCSPLTADDIRTLDQFCRDRCIILTPSLATFGHMGRILSLPQYRHLAEIPTDTPWESQSWLQRQRGLTIDVTNPKTQKLITRLLDEYLPLFASPYANVGADETHDLGQGKNKSLADKLGKGRLYVDHLKFLADACRRHNKCMMFWGDIIRNHAELMGELPDDAVLLDWGYEPDSEFPALTSPHRQNRDVIACPGTSGWKRVINDFTAAETNTTNAAKSAHQNNAAGMIVTDWGDDGHFNLLASSMPAIAFAANLAWNCDAVLNPSPDHAINRFLFSDAPDNLFTKLKAVAAPLAGSFSWQTLRDPAAPQPSKESANELSDAANQAIHLLHQTQINSTEINEWRLACQAAKLIADRQLVSPQIWNDDLRAFQTDYEQSWRTNNKPHRFHEIAQAITIPLNR